LIELSGDALQISKKRGVEGHNEHADGEFEEEKRLIQEKLKRKLTLMRYSTARSGLLNEARRAFMTCSRSNPMSIMLAIADWSCSPETVGRSEPEREKKKDELQDLNEGKGEESSSS